jgi:hypothetical protein
MRSAASAVAKTAALRTARACQRRPSVADFVPSARSLIARMTATGAAPSCPALATPAASISMATASS